MGMLDYVRRKTRARLLRGERVNWIENRPRRNYIRQVVLSCPDWVDRTELRRIKERAQTITEMTGIDHHIAHIIPLNHPRVCGLTVPWNLEILPAKKNMMASNHIHLDEQLTLF